MWLWQVFGELSVEIFWVLTLGSVSVAGAVVGEHGSSPNFSSLGRWQVKGHNLHKAEFYCSRQPARPRLEAPVIVSVVGRVIPALHWLLARPNSTVEAVKLRTPQYYIYNIIAMAVKCNKGVEAFRKPRA